MEWKIFGMEWKISVMEWNGMENFACYGIWRIYVPFHSMPCQSRHDEKVEGHACRLDISLGRPHYLMIVESKEEFKISAITVRSHLILFEIV